MRAPGRTAPASPTPTAEWASGFRLATEQPDALEPGHFERLLTMIQDGRPSWMQHSACRGMAVETFFPKRTTLRTDIDAALAVCARCSVAEPCRAFGMGQQFGIFGGMTENGRRRQRRREAAA